MLWKQHIAASFGLVLYGITRKLKSKGALDGLYFIIPYMYANYGLFMGNQHTLFEVGYPAHPLIIDRRRDVVNSICYYYPGILKHEIEFLHTKIHDLDKKEEPLDLP